MFIHGVITDIPSPEEHARRVEKQMQGNDGEGMVGVGVKKRTGGRPTFFRIAFANRDGDGFADRVVDTFEVGDLVRIEAIDESVRLVWELDEICRSSPVIRATGVGIEDWDATNPQE